VGWSPFPAKRRRNRGSRGGSVRHLPYCFLKKRKPCVSLIHRRSEYRRTWCHLEKGRKKISSLATLLSPMGSRTEKKGALKRKVLRPEKTKRSRELSHFPVRKKLTSPVTNSARPWRDRVHKRILSPWFFPEEAYGTLVKGGRKGRLCMWGRARGEPPHGGRGTRI